VGAHPLGGGNDEATGWSGKRRGGQTGGRSNLVVGLLLSFPHCAIVIHFTLNVLQNILFPFFSLSLSLSFFRSDAPFPFAIFSCNFLFLLFFFTQTTTPFVSLFLLLFHLIMKDINVFSFFTPSALCVVHTHTHTHTFLSRQKREDLSHPSRPLYVASGKRHLQLNDNASRISCAATFTHR
jgi:hypothetical protein